MPTGGTVNYPADDCRARVTAITNIGSNTVLTIDVGSVVGAGSTRWDPSMNGGYNTKAIIVDFGMPPGFRNYDLAKIQSVTYSPSYPYLATITLDRLFSNISTTISAHLTEIVLIHEWTNVYLTNWTGNYNITCAPWDSVEGTGGICMFYCSDTLIQSGYNGQVNADYCGWPAVFNGGGATGAPASSIIGTTGSGGAAGGGNASNASLTPFPWSVYLNIPYIDYGDNVAGNCSGTHYGGNGGYGASQNWGSGPHAGYPGTTYPSANWTTKYISLGNSSAGGYGGQGAGAGGYGGGGGGAHVAGQSAPTTGAGAPTIGDAVGGAGGMGARGGGFVYVHAANININTSNNQVFSAKGDGYIFGHTYYSNMEATSASPLDSAGKGGDGGNGANMYISGASIYPAGGGGVEGCQGNGADGGRSGKGGDAGFVWIVYNATNNATGSNVIATGGPGGPGTTGSKMGRQGIHGSHGTELSICAPSFDTALCHPVYATTTEKGIDTVCDCFDAFRILARMNSRTTIGSVIHYTNTSDTDIKAYKNSDILFAESDHIITTASCTQRGLINDTLFKCPLSCNTTSFFTSIATPTGTVDPSTPPRWVGWGTAASHYNGGFFCKGIITIGTCRVWTSNLYTDSLKDTLICSSTCSFCAGGDSSSTPRNGYTFSTADSGSKTSAEIHQELALQISTQPYGPIVIKPNDQYIIDSLNKVTNLQLMNAPGGNSVYATFNADGIQAYSITVTDMLGRQLYEKTMNVPSGDNNVNIGISGWKPGSYIVTLLHDGISYKKIFIITGQ